MFGLVLQGSIFVAALCLSYGIALVICVAFEFPLLRLENAILNPKKSTPNVAATKESDQSGQTQKDIAMTRL